MRILAVLEEGTWADHHIASSLRDLGHEVTVFHYGSAVGEFYGMARRRERRRKNVKLIELARELRSQSGLDLIFCYVYDDFLAVATARELARLGVPMVNLNVDMVNQWYRQSRTAGCFTRILCAQRANLDALARHGARTLYFPMAARAVTDSEGASTTEELIPAAPVTFLGTPMPHRVAVLAELHRRGIPLAIYGNLWRERQVGGPEYRVEKTLSDLWHYGRARLRSEGWSGFTVPLRERLHNVRGETTESLPAEILHGYVDASQVSSLFRNSAINIGFTRIRDGSGQRPAVNQLKLRDFEVPMAGGFYLVEEAPDYAELFEPGREVETWRSVEDLVEKTRYYLSHPEQRRAIAQAGQRKAVRDHTWEVRFSRLFEDMGLDGLSCVS